MGEVKGFKKYERVLPTKEKTDSRVNHYKEFYEKPDEELLNSQSARCMDCGVPFCHNGCPLGNIIPDFNEAVHKEDWQSAYDILSSTNNFPEFTGRICPAPCEASCVLNINSDPVTIELIEKSIIEKAFENGWVKPETDIERNGLKIAVVGSGPAGLAAADQLNKQGYSVDLYERNDRIGGLLRYGIPDFKLEKEVIDRRLDIMKQAGVKMHTGVNVGVDISVTELDEKFDAVVLCGGSTIPRDLQIPGRELKGVHFAMDYLEQNNKVVAGDIFPAKDLIKVTDQNVVVIGGGDTGADCVGTSNRLKAKSITQIELLAKPPASRSEEDLWPNWPMTLRTSSSHEEGCDRKWAIMTKRFISEDGKNLSGIELINVEWKKAEDGRNKLTEIVGTERIIPCEKAFLAIGFVSPQKEGLLNQLQLELDARDNVKTNDFKSSRDKFYAAGDMRRGQSLVVWAIAEGRQVAEAVNRDLAKSVKSEYRSVLAV